METSAPGRSFAPPALQFRTSGAVQRQDAEAEPTTISASVGVGGENQEEDVKVVQRLLVRQGHGITVDGDAGPSTKGSIRAFQRRTGIGSDGLVEVGGQTWERLNGSLINNEDVDLLWGDKVDEDFAQKAIRIANELGVDPNLLMSCMAFESGETFSPSILNGAGSGAVGLIQFMPSTAEGLGTTSADLAEMTAVEQLDYVRAYFMPYKGKLSSLEDIYMTILWPAAVGKSNDYVLWSRGTTAYRQNAGLDVNGDGSVTKGEAAAKVREKVERGENYRKLIEMGANEPDTTGGGQQQQEGGTENGGGSWWNPFSWGQDQSEAEQEADQGGGNPWWNPFGWGQGDGQDQEQEQEPAQDSGNPWWNPFGWGQGEQQAEQQPTTQPDPAPVVEARIYAGVRNGQALGSEADIMNVQTLLKQLGLYNGTVDGKITRLDGSKSNTTRAIEAFQAAQGLEVDGIVGKDTMTRLLQETGSSSAPTSSPRPVPRPEQDGGDQQQEESGNPWWNPFGWGTSDNDDGQPDGGQQQQPQGGDQQQADGGQQTADPQQEDGQTQSANRGITIEGNVGRDQPNANEDARKIQQGLRDVGFQTSVDGVAGRATVMAIYSFQRGEGLGQDGVISPTGETLRRLNAVPNGAYSNSLEQMAQDPNAPEFNHSRFNNAIKLVRCTDGTIVPEQYYGKMRRLIRNVNALGDNVNVQLHVNSGYRSPNYNASLEGAALASNHMYGEAIDISSPTWNSEQLRAKVEELIEAGIMEDGGLGKYVRSNFIHYDVGAPGRRWTR